MVAIVGGVNDDGVVSEAGFFERFQEASDGVINSGDHAVVGTHVRLVFLRGVPPPEVALPCDRGLQEVGEGVENGGVGETGRSDVGVFIETIGGLGPGEVADAGAAVTVFGVAGIEPHVEGEGFVLGL